MPEVESSDRLSAVVDRPFHDGSLVGSFFHSDHGWQGCVVAEVAPQMYLVELFEWIMGFSTVQRLIHLHKMTNWDFYDSADWLRNSMPGARSGQELAGTCEPGDGGSAPDTRTGEGEPAPNVDSISRVATTGVNREEGSPLLTTQTEEP